MYPTNPALQQSMMQLDQEYAQRKANLMQSFYQSQQNSSWNNQNTTAQAQTPLTQNVTWIPVSGLQAARDYIVQRNETAWMMDNNDAVFYVKKCDDLGVSDLKAYRFEEIPIEPVNVQKEIDMSKYVSKDEFDELKAQLDQFVSYSKKVTTKANKGVENDG